MTFDDVMAVADDYALGAVESRPYNRQRLVWAIQNLAISIQLEMLESELKKERIRTERLMSNQEIRHDTT